ncbi:MAG: TonB-dependent receptor [Acidobacteriia bacterium]|nr:TonB-dependent receptor [Terriglobia bacterium]
MTSFLDRILCRGIAVAIWLSCQTVAFCQAPAPGGRLEVVVREPDSHPAAGVRLELKREQAVVASAETNSEGEATFTQLAPGRYAIDGARDGFEPLHREIDLTSSGSTSLEWTLIPTLSRKESIDVQGTATLIEQGASTENGVPPQLAKALPSRPATVADALPLTPGVARSPGGGLQISGSAEHRSSLIVNSADVTDPATGEFGLTVPIDSVESLNVYQAPFLAEYGRFTAGLVSVETRRGGDRWKWELNDPFPDFRIRSYHMRGLMDATPRLNFEGPLIPSKLYFSEGFEYAMRKTAVYELPFPDNQKKQEGINSFAQLDWVASNRQLVTATVHVAPQRLQWVNINYFNPEPTSPDAGTHNYTATVADRWTLGGGLLENTLSVTRFDARVWGQGPLDLTIAPGGNSGNYFAQQNRVASRIGWLPDYAFAPVSGAGTHHFKMGAYIANSADRGQVEEHPVNIVGAAGQPIERIAFTGGQPYRMSDTEFAFYGQDHWILSPRLAADLGVRTESQEISEAFRVAPRAGLAFTPFARLGTVMRAGFGLFYDRVPLNVYAFANYPNQVVTLFDGAGQIAGGPFFYQNALGQVNLRSPFVHQEPIAGNFSPRSATASGLIEQPLARSLKLRVGYMQIDSAGLVNLNPQAPDPVTNMGAYTLSGAGRSRYRQFEVTTRVRMNEKSALFFSYVRSHARGDLNDFAGYLGSFPFPIIRPNQFANLPTDLPNRFLAWGVVQLPLGFRIAPAIEYRSGFPYVVTDAAQNYAGIPNQNRYPNFFSADSRFSKDFKVNPKYTVRLSISSFNLTNHFNPEALHTNIADPAYGFLFGQRGRRFTADFDVLF